MSDNFEPNMGTELLTNGKVGKTRETLLDGSLLCKDCRIARIGYQDYLKSQIVNNIMPNSRDDVVIPVYRGAKELFSENAIRSFESVPVTVDHPIETYVTPKNFKNEAVGYVRNVRPEDDFLVADLVIKDVDAINRIMSGERQELSAGYGCEFFYNENEGRWEQRNILGNHVAIVQKGRGGNMVKIGDNQLKECYMSQVDLRTFRDFFNRALDEAIDESAKKRHEDEVKGGEKANAILEGEHREEKRMRERDDRRDSRDSRDRCDSRDSRDSRDRRDARDADMDFGDIHDRLDEQNDLLKDVYRGIRDLGDVLKDIARKLDVKDDRDIDPDLKKGALHSNDESAEKRHKDDVRGGEVAEGEWRQKHGKGEKVDDSRDAKDAKDKRCGDEDLDEIESEDDARERIEDMSRDIAEDEGDTKRRCGDAAFNHVSQYTDAVAHIIAPNLTMSLDVLPNASYIDKMVAITAKRRAALDAGLRGTYGSIIKEIVGKRSVSSLSQSALDTAFNKAGRRVARHNNGTIKSVAIDTSLQNVSATGEYLRKTSQIQDTYKSFWNQN